MNITIDEKEIQVQEGQSILEAALAADIFIPHLCSHPDLEAKGGCRLCSVEVDGIKGSVASCMTKAEDGMKITVNGPQAEKIRKTAMELLLASHPADCTGCPKYGKCELQSMYQYMGVGTERWRKKVRSVANDDRNPLISHLFTRCVRCGRCIRACQDLRGVKVLDYINSGTGIRAGIPDGKTLTEVGCRFCGACIEVCPTGSIVDAVKIMKHERSYADNIVPCRSACPAHIDIPRYIRYIRAGEFDKATAVIREKVPFPEVLGSTCTHACEDECKRNELGTPVSVCKLKRAAAANDSGGWKSRHQIKTPTSKRVAVIGAGPTGLTAAYYLTQKGHAVTVFEKNQQAGGQCRYGIPAYRLPDDMLDHEIADILETGVELKTNVPATTPGQLKAEGYDTVLIAVGTHQGTKLALPGSELRGVSVNTEFLKKSRMNESEAIGSKVVVLGGGNVAYDCARTAIRLGATEVHIACLEQAGQMTATADEIKEGAEEGVILHAAHSFLRITGTDCVEGVELQKIEQFYFDENHQTVMKLSAEPAFTVRADMVIFAVGQKPEGTEAMEVQLTHGPYIQTNEKSETSIAGVYAAGDVVTGTKSVIAAIAAGRKVAEEMDKYMGGNGDISEQLLDSEIPKPYIGPLEGFADIARNDPPLTAATARSSGFEPVEQPFSCEQARCEAERCLQCDLRLNLSKPKLWNEY